MAGETVRVLPLGGTWEQLGADRFPGITPENLTCSANEWGSDTASFILRRDPAVAWPDLSPFCPIEIERAGVVGWTGRISDVSGDSGDGTTTVQCKGWQYHLDDDLIRRTYVHSKLTEWQDWRSNLAANLTTWSTALAVEAGEGGIVLTAPKAGQTGNCLAYLDAGPGQTFSRIVLDWAKTASSGNGLHIRAGNTLSELDTGLINALVDGAVGTSSGTFSYTLGTPCRYFGIQLSSSNGARAADDTARISRALLFSSTAYESGGVSIFTLDKLVKDVRDQGTDLLNTANDQIETFAFGIPDCDPRERRTPRELIALGQAYHDCMLQIDVDKKIVAKVRPSVPLFEVGAWSRNEFKDGSISGESLISGVIVEGQDAANQPLEVERTAQNVNPALQTLPDRQGFTKRVSVPLESSMTTTLGQAMGDVYIANHMTAPFKGEQAVTGYGDIRGIADGRQVHPFEMLTQTEQLLRLSDRIDPDTGDQGRDGRMKTVSYSADTEEGNIGIDNDSRRFEALASRMAAVVGS